MRPSACVLPLILLAALGACDTQSPAGDAARPDNRTAQRAEGGEEDVPAVRDAAPAPAPQLSPSSGSSSPPVAADPSPSVEITGPGRPSPQPLPTGRNILPLARILQIARAAVPGEVIEVELDEDDDDDDAPEYELEILTPQGRSIEVTIDARSGAILEIEED